jgi:transcriptional regulator with XRE-family HTH domain
MLRFGAVNEGGPALRKPISVAVAGEADGGDLFFKRRTVVVDGPDPIDQHVGGQVRLRRAQAGLTQTELGSKLGLSFQAVQKYESGENRISASRLYQLARILDVPVSYFFEGLEGPANSASGDPLDLGRKEASMVLGAYYAIRDARLRSACLLIMTRMAEHGMQDESPAVAPSAE